MHGHAQHAVVSVAGILVNMDYLNQSQQHDQGEAHHCDYRDGSQSGPATEIDSIGQIWKTGFAVLNPYYTALR